MALARTRSSAGRGGWSGGAGAGGAPVGFWWLLLALGSAWLRYPTAWGTLYPAHWLLAPLLAWALWRGPLAQPGGAARPGGAAWLSRRIEPPPLQPLLAFAGWVLLLTLLRAHWGAALTLILAAAALAPWAWAANRMGLGGAPLGTFRPAAILFLATTLAVGLLAWWAQDQWPAACVLLNCDPATPIPYAFRGGWTSSAQYLLLLLFLLPPVGGAFLESWRGGSGGAGHWLLTLIVAGAGLGLLAGMRWWGFLILALGLFLLGQALAAERHPADRLLLRGLIFFSIFTPVALYGMVPGYGTALLFPAGSARAVGVRHSLPGPVVLSSEHEVPVTVQVVNTGSVALSASADDPIRLRGFVLFTPRSGGDSRMAAAGEARIVRDLAPGETVDATVPIRVPAWVSQGYLSWAAEDESGRPIRLAEALHQGFRFVNADYSSLSEGGDNTLSALAARARESAAPALSPASGGAGPLAGTSPLAGTRRSLIEPVLSDAFDTIFFSPVWGQAGADRPFGQVFDPARPFLLQVLHRYGLIGLGLLAWFFADVLRRAIHLGFGRRSATGLAWRLVPVSVLLLAAVGLASGELGRFHSWWGCVLLGGFVQGVHERVFPSRGRGLLDGGPPRWLVRPLRAAGALVALLPALVAMLRAPVRFLIGALRVLAALSLALVATLRALWRGTTWIVSSISGIARGRRPPPRRHDWSGPPPRSSRPRGSPY